MRKVPVFSSLLLTTSLLLSSPIALMAADAEQLPQKVFDVQIVGDSSPAVEVTFALALSEVSSYPVTITAISGSVEELLYEGTLSEGCYKVRAPLTKITSGAIKLVLRTRVTNRTAQGPLSYLRYLTWEGTINR